LNPVVRLTDVRKSFDGLRAVDGVSFEVRPGTILGLLGRNGAGKTTTLRVINGILLPDSGSIELFGSADAGQDARDRIGYLPEERGLYKKMKVQEQLLFFAEAKRPLDAATRSRAETWLRRMELWDRRDAKIETLSKGNQQKVQLIASLLHDPDLLILDEPLAGLDPVNVVLVRGILRELKAQGKTLLLSTHLMGEAERTVDDIVLIHSGRVVLSGSLARVRESHGRDTVHLAFEGDGAFLERLPGVVRAAIHANAAELRLEPSADPQDLLQRAAARLRILRFEVAAPSLEEIFIDRVGTEGAAREAVEARA
jgi:ABC-2 type transport system ATP-binding protein